MARERKSKTLTYKCVRFHAEASRSLKSMLGSALKKLSKIGERRQSMGPEDESPIWRVVGQYHIDSDFVFGVLIQYSPGSNPLFLVDDGEAEILKLEQLSAPPTEEGKRREPLDGVLFFGVMENHLVLMQSASLRTDHLETHLQWLLHNADVLKADNTFVLMDQPPRKVREMLKAQEVREVDVGGELLPSEALQPSAVESQEIALPRESKVQSVTLQNATADSDRLAAFIRGLMRPADAAKLNLDHLAGSNIEYTLKLRYKRATSDDGQKLMNTLGTALRHADGVNTTLHLKGGGTITSQELRLSGPIRIDTYNGVPSPAEVFEAMRKWLLDKVKSGDVAAS